MSGITKAAQELKRVRNDPIVMAQARTMSHDLPKREDWMPWSACKGEDTTEVFFHEGGDGGGGKVLEPAYRLCVGCAVQAECLATAMVEEKGRWRYGVFGGLSPRERTDLSKVWGRKA